ncbi:hypothetical protein ACFL09_00825 [Planctomycetota bacterium]
MQFDRELLACANEVFPEAALADPVADLEVWDEWRTGVRRFPYPGVYTRLDILRQERKTSATSSVGVLGEILAGRFCQSYVAPLVCVRPIRHWPDFIFLGSNQRYSFVESKASVTLDRATSPGLLNIRDELLGEGLADAVQELNAEPFLRVWLVFTDVTSVQPLTANVSVLETRAPHSRRVGRQHRVPDAVIDGLAERLFIAAAAELEPEFQHLMGEADDDVEQEVRKEIWARLKRRAAEQTEQVLPEAVPEELQRSAADAIRQRIRSRRARKISVRGGEGRRLAVAKREAASGVLAALRRAWGADEWLLLADLPPAELEIVREGWRPDWQQANQLWGEVEGLQLWRCSSAVLGLGERRFAGARVEQAKRHQRPGEGSDRALIP